MFGESILGKRPTSDIPVVTLKSTDGNSSCEVFLYGASVISWISNTEERLFLSTEALMDGSFPVRGGIPLAFPQYGQPIATMAQHGFVRNFIWKYLGSQIDDKSMTAYFRFDSNEDTRKIWDHQFFLIYAVQLLDNQLVTTMSVGNNGLHDFSFQTLLHTYFRVPDISNTAVVGLKGHVYLDKLANYEEKMETGDMISFDKETDRAYHCSRKDNVQPRVFKIIDLDSGTARMDISVSANRIQISESIESLLEKDLWDSTDGGLQDIFVTASSPFDEQIATDVVVWNPWINRAKQIIYLYDDSYLSFVCVEPGLLSKFHDLSPRQIIRFSQTFTAGK